MEQNIHYEKGPKENVSRQDTTPFLYSPRGCCIGGRLLLIVIYIRTGPSPVISITEFSHIRTALCATVRRKTCTVEI